MLKIENIEKVEGLKVFVRNTVHIIVHVTNGTALDKYGILMHDNDSKGYWISLDRKPAFNVGKDNYYSIKNESTNEVVQIHPNHIKNPEDFATIISRFLDGRLIN